MKSKKTTYLLLTLSIVIWLTVGWKIYRAFNADTVEPVARKIIETLKKDSISLLLNYKDPFLGGYNVTAREQKAQPVTQKKVVPTIKSQPERPTAPEFQMKGTLNIGEAQTAILQKSNQTFTLKIGETLDGFRIIAINENRIVICKDGKRYELSIQ